MTVDSQKSKAESLRSELSTIIEEADKYFEQIHSAIEASLGYQSASDVLTADHRELAHQLRQRLTAFGSDLLAAVKNSPVLEQTDEIALKRVLRKMSAALSLKEWQYHEPYIIHDEDQFHGVMPASQEERDSDYRTSAATFFDGAKEIEEKIDMIAPTSETIASAIVASQVAGVRKYRPNTAFIIMQIDELER
jgi:hypothetical protein